jgi:hypothetical protein
MSHGSRETLEEELEALLRQRDQYSLALDAATDPQASVRLQRTLERLEDEVEGLREALAALPNGPVPAPDWEDEPATAIFDPEVIPAPVRATDREAITLAMPAVPPPSALIADDSPSRRPSEESTDPARPLYDLDAEMKRARESGLAPKVRAQTFDVRVPPGPMPTRPVDPEPRNFEAAPEWFEPQPAARATEEPATQAFVRAKDDAATQAIEREPGAAEPLPAADPTINVTPPVDSVAEDLRLPLKTNRAVDPSYAVDPPTVLMPSRPKPSRPQPDPLGPVVLDALEPPTGENPRVDDEPPSDPFALPGGWGAQPSASDWGRASTATPIDDASPFGSTAIGPAAFDASSVSDVSPEGEWSAGSKIALALVVAAFLTGVGWVLTQ